MSEAVDHSIFLLGCYGAKVGECSVDFSKNSMAQKLQTKVCKGSAVAGSRLCLALDNMIIQTRIQPLRVQRKEMLQCSFFFGGKKCIATANRNIAKSTQNGRTTAQKISG